MNDLISEHLIEYYQDIPKHRYACIRHTIRRLKTRHNISISYDIIEVFNTTIQNGGSDKVKHLSKTRNLLPIYLIEFKNMRFKVVYNPTLRTITTCLP